MTNFLGNILTTFTSTGTALLATNHKFPSAGRIVTAFVVESTTVLVLQLGDPYTSTTLMKVIGVESGASDAEVSCTIVDNKITLPIITTAGTGYIDDEEVIFVDPKTTSNSARGTVTAVSGPITAIVVTNGGDGGTIIADYRSMNVGQVNVNFVVNHTLGFNLQLSSGEISFFSAVKIDQ